MPIRELVARVSEPPDMAPFSMDLKSTKNGQAGGQGAFARLSASRERLTIRQSILIIGKHQLYDWLVWQLLTADGLASTFKHGFEPLVASSSHLKGSLKTIVSGKISQMWNEILVVGI